MNITFTYIQDSEGKISHLRVKRDRFIPYKTIGDEMALSCLKDYSINEDKKGFSFNMEYDSTMQKILEIT